MHKHRNTPLMAAQSLLSLLLAIALLLPMLASCELASIFTPGVEIITPPTTLAVGDSLTLECKYSGGRPKWTASNNCISVSETSGEAIALREGLVWVTVTVGDASDSVLITVSNALGSVTTDPVGDDTSASQIPPSQTVDPYATVSESEFYADYEPAESYYDAYWRTYHGFMSGSVAPQAQEPTLAADRPKQDGLYIRNTSSFYSADKNTYFVLDSDGEVAYEIYRGGAYVALEEVAAYLMAFGDIPPNYTSSKKGDPATDKWGIYLRLNHTKFSGSTSKYPYEPELPRISGCGGDLTYYEIDIGTTGTDCDPSYTPRVYNDGNRITRGAARIVYTRYDRNGNGITEPDERYVFYTYNHYNDFCEYLNYSGGWGETFGNITGGGTLSSKTHYNPTPYVQTARAELSSRSDLPAVASVCPTYIWLALPPEIKIAA